MCNYFPKSLAGLLARDKVKPMKVEVPLVVVIPFCRTVCLSFLIQEFPCQILMLISTYGV